jgi:hypothetical protein
VSSRLRHLPLDVAELLERCRGVVDIAIAARAGIDASRLRRLVAAGLLVRLAPGCYTSTAILAAASSWAEHRLRARAFALYSGDSTFLTGWSSAATWQLPAVGQAPKRVTAIRPDDAGHKVRRGPYGDIRTAAIPPGQARRVEGIGVMSPGWAVAEAARSGPVLPALVAADAAAAAGHDLRPVVPAMAGWLGVARARWVAEHADPRAESPLETLGRFTCLQFDLPLPVCNAWVGENEPEFRVDGLWPYHWVAFEADGALKYDNRPDASRIHRAAGRAGVAVAASGARRGAVRVGAGLAESRGTRATVRGLAPRQRPARASDPLVEACSRCRRGRAGAGRLALSGADGDRAAGRWLGARAGSRRGAAAGGGQGGEREDDGERTVGDRQAAVEAGEGAAAGPAQQPADRLGRDHRRRQLGRLCRPRRPFR